MRIRMVSRARGIALITVLIAASVLSMLCISLVLISRSGLLTGEQFRRRQDLMQTCLSAVDYAKVRLAQSGGAPWATQPLSGSYSDADLEIQESGFLINGTLKATGGSFQMRVLNNLKGLTPSPAPPWCRTGVQIRPKTALVVVDGLLEGQRRHLEVLLQRDSYLNSVAYSAGDLVLNTSTNVSSVLPRGASARAGNRIFLTDPNFIKFAPQGLLQSGTNTSINSTVGVDGSTGNLTSASGTDFSTLSSGQQGNVTVAMSARVQAGSPPASQRFTPDKLQVPGGAEVTLDPGEYHFLTPNTVRGPDGVVHTNNLLGAVRLKDYRFMPDPSRKVVVNGNLTLTAEITHYNYVAPTVGSPWGSISASNTTSPFQASLGLGYGTLGLPSGAGAQNRFSVNGNLTITGDIIGSGQLFVGDTTQGGRLTVNGNSFLSGTRTQDLAVVAHDSIIVNDVSSQADQLPFAGLPGDFGAFGAAMNHVAASGNTSLNTTLNNYSAANSTSLLELGNATLTATIGDVATYRSSSLSGMFDSGSVTFGGGGVNLTGATLNGIDLAKVPVSDHSAHTTAPVSVLRVISDYVNTGNGNVTLEKHLHVREYLKSVTRGEFNTHLLDPSNAAFAGDPGLADATFAELANLAIHQIAAYNLDARTAGNTLMQYMPTSLTPGFDPYTSGSRFDFSMGGIMYARRNILLQINSKFRLLGGMLTQDPSAAITLMHGTNSLVFDPTVCEDQFDLTRLGFVPTLFWTD